MKTLGLIGGTSWLSTIEYYRYINEYTASRLGSLHSAKLYMCSIDLAELVAMGDRNDWDGVLALFAHAAKNLERTGAEGLVICANTPHKIADGLQKQIGIPLIHIADATAAAIKSRKLRKVGLLGTKVTMEDTFITDRLIAHGIESIVPPAGERAYIQRTIFEELGRNIFTSATKQRYVEIIRDLVSSQAEGIILGCTEIPLLIKQEDSPVPVFDTSLNHARAAVDFALDV